MTDVMKSGDLQQPTGTLTNLLRFFADQKPTAYMELFAGSPRAMERERISFLAIAAAADSKLLLATELPADGGTGLFDYSGALAAMITEGYIVREGDRLHGTNRLLARLMGHFADSMTQVTTIAAMLEPTKPPLAPAAQVKILRNG